MPRCGRQFRCVMPPTTVAVLVIRWEGALAPMIWMVPRPQMSVLTRGARWRADTCTSSARPRPTAFAEWAGISRALGVATLRGAAARARPVRSPIGDAWLLAADEAVDARRRTALPRRRACCPAVTRSSCCGAATASCSSRIERRRRGAVDVARVARRAARQWRDHGRVASSEREGGRSDCGGHCSVQRRDAVEAEAQSIAVAGPDPGRSA